MILLDRDGVLNEMVVDPDQGTVDSPLHPGQVRIFPWVPSALRSLTLAGFRIAVVSNQPAAAKGKTTRALLEAVHGTVMELAAREGGIIHSSHLCFHRAEDGCGCRKPRPGLLAEALDQAPEEDRRHSWMVGDGITDVQAGKALGLRAAFLCSRKCEVCRILTDRGVSPDYWGDNLAAFVDYLIASRG